MLRIKKILALLAMLFTVLVAQGQTGEYFYQVTGLAYDIPLFDQLHVSIDCGGMYNEGFYLNQISNFRESEILVVPENASVTIWVEEESITVDPTPGSHEYTVYPYGTTSPVYVILTLKVYDVPKITFADYDGFFNISASPAQNIAPGSIYYLNCRYLGGDWVRSSAIPNIAYQVKSVVDYYGGSVPTPPCGYTFEFRYSVRISGLSGEIFGNIFSGVKPPELGEITINNIHRQACPDYVTIEIGLDPIVASDPNRFNINIHNPLGFGIEDDIYTRENAGNKIYLRFNSVAGNLELLNGNYLLEVSDKNLVNSYCPKEVPFNPGDPVLPLDIVSATPVVVASAGGTDYHIPRYGESLGQAELILNLEGRLSGFQIKRSDWPAFVACSATKTDGVYTISGLSAGSYTVMCTDTDGCISETKNFTIVQPAPFSINDKSVTDAPCHPDNTNGGTVTNMGSLSFRINGGIPSYTVKLDETIILSDVSGTIYLPDLEVGNYKLNVSNGFQESTFYMSVGTPAYRMTITESHTNILCKGDANGTITLTANNNANAISGFTFTNTTAPTEVISANIRKYSSLTPGVYGGTVTDTEGCTATIGNIPVTEPPNSLSVSATSSKIAEYGDNTGTIRLVISGGTANYSYTLFKEGETYTSGSSSGTTNITGLYAGTYSAAVTDANGCTAGVTDIKVIQPEAPLTITIKNIVDVSCNGYNDGEVTVEASGGWEGYFYQFNNGVVNTTGVFTGLSATDGTVNVFVIDAEGVTVGTAVVVSQPAGLVVSGTNVYNLKCYYDNSGAVKLSVSGGTPGYSISLNGFDWVEGDSIGGLSAATNRTLYVKDAHGCTTQSLFTITEPEPLLISSTMEVVDAHCGQDDGAISMQVTGGTIPYSYTWTNTGTGEGLGVNDSRVNDLYAGNYQMRVIDFNGCSTTRSAIVNNINGPSISVGRLVDVSCYGYDNGLVYLSFNGVDTIFHYTLNKLEGGTTTLIKEGEGSYYIEIGGLSEGEYLFSITDSEGCSSSELFTINQPEPMGITGEVVDPGCHDSYDGFIAINVTGGNGEYTYRWSNNTTEKNLEYIPAGEYSVFVKDQKSCNIDTSFILTAPAPPVVTLAEIEDVICSGNSLVIDGGEHSSYTWYLNGEIMGIERYLTVWEQGYYVLEATDGRGCANRDSVFVEVSDTPLATFFLLQDTAMTGETVQAIDVTWPVPDKIEWYFDPSVEEEGGESWSANFYSDNPGIVNVTLRAWYGGCYSDSTKTITIIDEEYENPDLRRNGSIIAEMRAYPNPTDGNFRVVLELEERADITLTLYNNMGGIIESRKLNVDRYTEMPFSFDNLLPGVYLLVTRTGTESKQLRIIIR
jgi:hypothetical protein